MTTPLTTPRADSPASPRQLDWQRVLLWAAWPLAIINVIHRTVLTPYNSHPTDDFSTVWNALVRFRDGVPVYNENYATVDPHYLYSPGGTLILSPIAWAPSVELARTAYIWANSLAIILSILLLARMMRVPWRSALIPLSIAGLFLTESVTNTLLFSNINGVLLLCLTAFLALLLTRHDLAAGLVLGIAITIKPQFAPLLFLPFVRRQWLTIASALAVPVLSNIIGFLAMTNASDYVSLVMPYLGVVRDYANSSISGVGVYFGIHPLVVLALRALAALMVIALLIGLLRWKDREPLFWAASTSAVLLTGVFLVSSLGQMYYSMWLLPLMATILLPRSIMHNPATWVALYLCFSPDSWSSDRWPVLGEAFEYTRGTLGWALLLASACALLVVWISEERKAGLHPWGDLARGWTVGGVDLPAQTALPIPR